MDVTLRLTRSTTDELRSLRSWLAAEDALRGRVEAVETGPETGRLGPDLTGLLVDLIPGAAPALAAVVIAWIRSRRGDIDLTAEHTGDRTTISVSARRVRGLDPAALHDEITSLARALEPGPPPDSHPPGTATGDNPSTGSSPDGTPSDGAAHTGRPAPSTR
jgi:hypothetical protein